MKPAVCLCFQVHQPYRLRAFDFFSIGEHLAYEDAALNSDILEKVAGKCYDPALALFRRAAERHAGKFRFTLSLSGSVLEQLEQGEPAILRTIRELVEAGTAGLLSETYDHSLAFLFSRREFRRQVTRHKKLLERLFGVEPRVFRNTELLYSDALADELAGLGFAGCLAEGVPWLLAGQTANRLWGSAGEHRLSLFLRNRSLSDDLAFRFGDPSWVESPLQPDKFQNWIEGEAGEVVNLFMDLEALGEHLGESSGIFEFWEEWIDLAIAAGVEFVTPEDLASRHVPARSYHCPAFTSWADLECDESAWLGNAMQREAAEKVYSLEESVRSTGDAGHLRTWGRLQTSDHFYYMSTKRGTDGAVHDYFNPHGNPHDYYTYYMNALADFQLLLATKQSRPGARKSPEAALRS